MNFVGRFLPRIPRLSYWSSPPIPDSMYASEDFLLGAGMVVIQRTSHKVLLVYETERKYWFLPKGRKDVGESLEQTALREAYEESGYRVEFLPLYSATRAPRPPQIRGAPIRPDTEPIFVTTQSWRPRRRRNRLVDHGGEYFATYYVGQIAEDAVHEPGTGMADEQNYTSHLLTISEALEKLGEHIEARIVLYAWNMYCYTIQRQKEEEVAHQRVAQHKAAGQQANAQELPEQHRELDIASRGVEHPNEPHVPD